MHSTIIPFILRRTAGSRIAIALRGRGGRLFERRNALSALDLTIQRTSALLKTLTASYSLTILFIIMT